MHSTPKREKETDISHCTDMCFFFLTDNETVFKKYITGLIRIEDYGEGDREVFALGGQRRQAEVTFEQKRKWEN